MPETRRSGPSIQREFLDLDRRLCKLAILRGRLMNTKARTNMHHWAKAAGSVALDWP